jgi:hypothetical protein
MMIIGELQRARLLGGASIGGAWSVRQSDDWRRIWRVHGDISGEKRRADSGDASEEEVPRGVQHGVRVLRMFALARCWGFRVSPSLRFDARPRR